MEKKRVEFRFKGMRNYIHGTDMFNTMTGGYQPGTLENIRFTIHNFVWKPSCDLFQANSKEALNSRTDAKVRCQFDCNGSTHYLVLVEQDGDTSTGSRYEYDEDRIVALTRTPDDFIELTQKSPFTFIETVVAMNKHLLQTRFPKAPGKWAFTRIDLTNDCDDREKIALHFRHNMNFRLTKTDVLVDGQEVGDIYFSLVKS